jgi:hypothetical protein
MVLVAAYAVNPLGVEHARSLIDAFICGDFRRVHRMGLIACLYRAAEWRHKEIERAAYELLQHLDRTSS